MRVIRQSWSWVFKPLNCLEIIEEAGRTCYKSEDKIDAGSSEKFARMLLRHGHGSVIEHGFASVRFITNRGVTHELVRHRAGTAISQESLRFVRLESLSTYVPIHIRESEEGMAVFTRTVEQLEALQKELADLYAIDDEGRFDVKKKLTSAFRRLAPIGVATTIGWSCNIRTLRHVIELRTDPHAEEEIRLLFGKVYEIVRERYPNFFSDYEVEEVDGLPWIRTDHGKV